MKIEKDYQKLFPKRRLSPDELLWCLRYENTTGFEPTSTADVSTQEDFVKMMKANIEWFTNWSEEASQIAERSMRDIPYYEKVVYA